jgi:hypothetical protein
MRSLLLIPLLLCCAPAAAAAPEPRDIPQPPIEEIIVWGRAETQKGRAGSASEGLVGYADFSTRPLQRVGELVEVVPGMVATQHSGEGKANQYFLRGMNLDHGTDFSAYFEGMPVNLRAHAHGQGYLDLNFLIPEVIRTVSYRKGPYRADRGDFSTAGTTSFRVYDELDPFVELSGGSYDYRRGVAAGSMSVGPGHLLGALELTRNDGPWDLAQDVRKTNALGRYSGTWAGLRATAVASLYDNEWRSTDQVPERLVDAGVIDDYGFIDPDLGGKTRRYSLIGGLEGERFSAGAYVSRYELNLFGNFTYFAEDPINGDEHEQMDRRWISGGHADYRFDPSDRASLRLGADARFDAVSAANLYRTTARRRRAAVREDSIEWLSLGTFAELDLQWSERLRSSLGLRADHYRFDVDALNPANGGDAAETTILPSLGAAYALNDLVEVYANWGKGFHSNDVRGVTIRVDPTTGEPVDPVDLFVDQQGAEVGLRLESRHGLSATVAYFWLESDSELLFVGDSGSTEPDDASERTGVELSAFWIINERWTADLILADVDSRFVGAPPDEDHIPNAHGRIVGAGLTYAAPRGLTASLRARHFGDAPLVEDNSVRHGSTTIVSARLGWDFDAWALGVDLINLLDSRDHDIAYFFESRLAGEPAAVEDVHFHPVDPRSVRVRVRRNLGTRRI